MNDDFAVVILAGGRARRLPGKLHAMLGDATILERVVANLKPLGAEIVLSVDADFDPTVARVLDTRIVVDVAPERGPVSGLASTIATIAQPKFFVAAGDAPFLDIAFALALIAAARDGDEAVVSFEGAAPLGRLHPIPGYYEREAFANAAKSTLATEKASLHAVLARLAVRRVAVPEGDDRLLNVNTPEDLEKARTQLGDS